MVSEGNGCRKRMCKSFKNREEKKCTKKKKGKQPEEKGDVDGGGDVKRRRKERMRGKGPRSHNHLNTKIIEPTQVDAAQVLSVYKHCSRHKVRV